LEFLNAYKPPYFEDKEIVIVNDNCFNLSQLPQFTFALLISLFGFIVVFFD